jgi:hypothetical protein
MLKGRNGLAAPLAALVGAVAALALTPVVLGAEAVTPGVGKGEKPVKVESIAGSSVKQVTLSAKAAQRLGIKMAAAAPAVVMARKWTIGAEVTAVSSSMAALGNEAAAAAAAKVDSMPVPIAATSRPAVGGNDAWIRVVLSEREAERVAVNQPGRVLPLVRDGKNEGIVAHPAKTPPEMRRDGAVALQYVTSGGADGMAPGKRVRLELPLLGSGAPKKVVPYGAVLYDAKGTAWVYASNAPLTYVRQKIEVDYIEGDHAVLLDGPPAGTMVVTVGAALLYGAETQGK